MLWSFAGSVWQRDCMPGEEEEDIESAWTVFRSSKWLVQVLVVRLKMGAYRTWLLEDLANHVRSRERVFKALPNVQNGWWVGPAFRHKYCSICVSATARNKPRKIQNIQVFLRINKSSQAISPQHNLHINRMFILWRRLCIKVCADDRSDYIWNIAANCALIFACSTAE